VNIDGSGLRAVVQHESDNVFYASPRFDASGNVIYFHRRAAIITNGSFTGNDDAIERLDLRTGERKRIVKDGADPTISPDGKTLIYVHLKDGQVDALWRADIDGTNARPLCSRGTPFGTCKRPGSLRMIASSCFRRQGTRWHAEAASAESSRISVFPRISS
jgi:Tol biopolymer transport system component